MTVLPSVDSSRHGTLNVIRHFLAEYETIAVMIGKLLMPYMTCSKGEKLKVSCLLLYLVREGF